MSGFSLDGSGWSRRIAGRVDGAIVYNASKREVSQDGTVLGDDIFEVLGQVVEEDPGATWVGYLGYACRGDLAARPAAGVPDAVWMRSEDSAETTASSRAESARSAEISERSAGRGTYGHAPLTPPTYASAFDEVQRRLRSGDSYEVNLTRRVQLDAPDVDPHEVYARLCAINPAPYAAHLWHEGTHVLSASPECFVTVGRGRVRTKPIKGTTPRGTDPEADQAQRVALATSPRYRAENLMITDLMRNDLAQVCVPGSVLVPALMQVESYAAVHQLVSTIEGDLRPGISMVEAIRALFPAGSMTGAPKRRTMEIIDEVEDSPRGIYSGALGWISGDACELSVVIRSLVRDPQRHWQAGTGGGITVQSDAASEWAESEWKLERLVSALSS